MQEADQEPNNRLCFSAQKLSLPKLKTSLFNLKHSHNMKNNKHKLKKVLDIPADLKRDAKI